MSYVDAYFDRKKNQIHVVERDKDGHRRFKTYPAKYVFYYEDPKGKYTTIFGNKAHKYETNNKNQFDKELEMFRNGKRIYESDIDPVFRCLEENYGGQDGPDLHIGIFDIEVNFNPTQGFANTDNPYAEINAVTVHRNWLDRLDTLVLKPDTMSEAQAQEVVRKFENTILCKDEKELLTRFLNLIEDVDVLSGWFSEFFDIPYVIERIKRVLGNDYTRQMCLWEQTPRTREIDKFGKVQKAYDLVGRISMDYLDLFKKHSQQQYHSYRLDFIGEQEVGERKIAYDGTLDQLFKGDFYKFIEYNRQDVALLVKIDQKNKFIELANQVAHTNGVLLKTTMGSVQLIDQAIVNEAHRRGMIIHDKVRTEVDEEMGAAGAYVADPRAGLHEDIGAVDINSLYPSVIRSLNMCTETLVAQIVPTKTKKLIQERINIEEMSPADAWHGMFGTVEYNAVFARDDTFDIVLEVGNVNDKIQTQHTTAAELYDFIFNPDNNLCISANGTIFKTDVEGIIPGLLTKWYRERKEMQAKKKEAGKLASQEQDPEKRKEYEAQIGFWDQRQYVRKILLNSLYGALLNSASKFYDHRLGQSVTLTGRCITRHMIAEINHILTDKYDHMGEAIIYSDTDSCYFSASKLVKGLSNNEFDWSKENIVQLYDMIGEQVNGTFDNFMKQAFNVPEEKSVIAASRESVASRGLFIKKKRYAVLVYDLEGARLDLVPEQEAIKKKMIPNYGKVKSTGLDTKRTDTPKPIQDFLTSVLEMVLQGKNEEDILEYITDFREEFKTWPAYLKGRPVSANKLNHYLDFFNNPDKRINGRKPTIPGHIRGAIHWNLLRQAHGDYYSQEIQDGQKIIVCKLGPNPMRWDCIAYPVDEFHLPKWFKELPFDSAMMEDKIIDQKLQNLFGVLNFDLESTKRGSTYSSIFVAQSSKK